MNNELLKQALEKCERLAIESGAHESYKAVRDAFEELRAAMQERDAEIERLTSVAIEHRKARLDNAEEAGELRTQVAAQRKVLEQALEDLENWRALDGSEVDRRLLTKDIANTITAIQEQLK